MPEKTTAIETKRPRKLTWNHAIHGKGFSASYVMKKGKRVLIMSGKNAKGRKSSKTCLSHEDAKKKGWVRA